MLIAGHPSFEKQLLHPEHFDSSMTALVVGFETTMQGASKISTRTPFCLIKE
jgi:hypothetical protein